MRLTVCLEGNTEGRVLASVDLDKFYEDIIAEVEENAENRMQRILDDEKRLSYETGKENMLDTIIRAEENKYFCDEYECDKFKDCSDCRIKYLENLREQNNG